MNPKKDHKKPAHDAKKPAEPPNDRLAGCPSSTVSPDDDITPCLDNGSHLTQKPDAPPRRRT